MSVFFFTIMKNYYALTFFIFCSTFVTAQQNYETEKIIWNSITYPYRYHHMEQYFRYYPHKRPVVSTDSTIVNRNYRALFEVKEDKFYLKDLYIKDNSTQQYTTSTLHTLNERNEPILLNWVTGLFDIGVGTEKFLKSDSTNVVYDQYIVFEVKRGVVSRTQIFNYREMQVFKDYQYKRFKNTPEYDKLVNRLILSGMTIYQAHYHINQFILLYSRSNFLKK